MKRKMKEIFIDEEELAEFFVLGSFPSLNDVISKSKRHWSGYAKDKRILTKNVRIGARKLKPLNQKVSIHCHWQTKNRRKDPDNIAFGIKYILDGLVSAGILRNDGWKEIGTILHTFEVNNQNPGVRVRLYASGE